MDIPKYLQILWSAKWLLLVGLVVSVIAAVLAGYRLDSGGLVPRADSSYQASTTVLVSSPDQSIYQAEVPGQTVQQGSTAPQSRDLTQTAVVYAYIIAGSTVRDAVQAKIGALRPSDSITAVRRTTQPGGDEKSPGRFSLPILDVVGTSDSPARAERISREANTAFRSYVAAQQNASSIPAGSRVQLETIDEGSAIENTGSNSAIPLVVTGLGVFLLFIALAFILHNIRTSRRRRTGALRVVAHARSTEHEEPRYLDPHDDPALERQLTPDRF
jgi:hypothetical protein